MLQNGQFVADPHFPDGTLWRMITIELSRQKHKTLSTVVYSNENITHYV